MKPKQVVLSCTYEVTFSDHEWFKTPEDIFKPIHYDPAETQALAEEFYEGDVFDLLWDAMWSAEAAQTAIFLSMVDGPSGTIWFGLDSDDAVVVSDEKDIATCIGSAHYKVVVSYTS